MITLSHNSIVGSITALICTCVAGTAVPALANDATDIPTVTVRYADLNLHSAAGIAALYARLRTASRKVCHAHESRELKQRTQWRACYDDALDTAIEQISLPELTMLHRRTPAPLPHPQ